MTERISLPDRLWIEKTVWTLDQQLYDLPRQRRISHRRELRTNLMAASRSVGAREAVRQLGGTGHLAADYLDAELGTGPRGSWLWAMVFVTMGLLLGTSLLHDATWAFAQGVLAMDPQASGTFTWPGIDYLQTTVHYTFSDGEVTWTGGAWTPLAYGLFLIGGILVGRLWRYLPSYGARERV